jgi:endonuclease/exonuclease/phosphatase family metal-dependent hydrolase
MKILVWNTEYWYNFNKYKWLKRCKSILFHFLNEINVDFVILQEINPFKLFEIEYSVNEYLQYSYSEHEKFTIFYHELYHELPKRYRNNPWGNAIIVGRKLKNYIKNNQNDNTNYYGRNVFMSYTFELYNEERITLINFYNKSNNIDIPFQKKLIISNFVRFFHYN